MERDTRNVAIDKVGVKDIHYPIVVMDKNRDQQHTVARINMYVDLPHHFKGTHMSRFVEILNRYRGEITMRNMGELLQAMKDRLNASCAHIEMDFPYFIEKQAPVSKALSLMEYRCCLRGTLAETKDFVLAVEVPLTALCPCSKEISVASAHSQRGMVSVVVRYERFFWIEDLIELIESCGSSPVYAILKRPDEKFITEHAYAHPMFVEDVVRQAAAELAKHDEFSWFSVEAENIESIHNHNAYAYIEGVD